MFFNLDLLVHCSLFLLNSILLQTVVVYIYIKQGDVKGGKKKQRGVYRIFVKEVIRNHTFSPLNPLV